MTADEIRDEGAGQESSLRRVDSKLIECLKCGRVSRVSKEIPIKRAWCPECKSQQIRLYRGERPRP